MNLLIEQEESLSILTSTGQILIFLNYQVHLVARNKTKILMTAQTTFRSLANQLKRKIHLID